jgi:hypothetical protein
MKKLFITAAILFTSASGFAGGSTGPGCNLQIIRAVKSKTVLSADQNFAFKLTISEVKCSSAEPTSLAMSSQLIRINSSVEFPRGGYISGQFTVLGRAGAALENINAQGGAGILHYAFLATKPADAIALKVSVEGFPTFLMPAR